MAPRSLKTELDALKICRLCLSERSLADVFSEEGLHRWISDYLAITISTEDSISRQICVICRLRLTEFHQFRAHCQRVQDTLQCMIRPSVRSVGIRKAVPEAEVQYVSHQLDKPLEDYNDKELDGREVTEVDQSILAQDRLMEVKIEAEDEEIYQKYGTHKDAVEQIPSHESMQDTTFEAVKLESDPVESSHNIVQNQKTDNHAELQDKTVRDENLIGIDDMMVLEEVKIESEDLTSDMEDQASSIHIMTEDFTSDYSTAASFNDELVQSEEANSSSTQQQCKICLKELPSKKALSNHNRIHRKHVPCPVCRKLFTRRSYMQRHFDKCLTYQKRNVKKETIQLPYLPEDVFAERRRKTTPEALARTKTPRVQHLRLNFTT